jgi:ubiquinone/menaquinone biosynthesis C-methylase UbiE
LKRKKAKKLRIADLGCGGGDMLKLVAKWAKMRKVEVSLPSTPFTQVESGF